MMPDVDLVGLC